MEPYKPSPKHADKRIAAIHFPLSLWKKIQAAAAEQDVSASEWVRQACQRRLERP